MTAFEVTTRSDVVDGGDGVLSLREAISRAEAHAGADTITFSSSAFTPGAASIALALGELHISQAGGALTIRGDLDGNGIAEVTIDAGGHSRVLQIAGASGSRQADVTLDHLVVTGGGTSDAQGSLAGAGIAAHLAHLTITGSTIFGNAARNGDGGGLYAREASVHITDSSVAGNSTSGYASGPLHMAAGGGGIAVVDGTLGIENTSVGDNGAFGGYTADGGSIIGAPGGGIRAVNSTVGLSSSDVSRNFSGNGGGISGAYSTVTVSGTTVGQNRAGTYFDGHGGGLDVTGGSLTLTGSTVSGNSAEAYTGGRAVDGSGGGIAAEYGAVVSVTGTTISGNSATSGGGISAVGASDITVLDSTITDNEAFQDGIGGGVLLSGGTLALTNTTVGGNRASTLYAYYGGGNGGGIWSDGTVVLTNCTLAENAARVLYSYGPAYDGVGAGGGLYVFGGTVAVRNTIIAGNIADRGDDVSGTIGSNGHNLFSQTGIDGAAGGDILAGADVLVRVLAPLGDNGGATQTYALLPWSLAVDAGRNADALDAHGHVLGDDQRGDPRIVGGVVDIGAVEFAGKVLAGTGDADVIIGHAADDAILGLAGDDTLIGNAGNDSIGGGLGNDHIGAGDGADIVFGDDGNDSIDCGTGDDLVAGGGGDDVIHLGTGNDRIVDSLGAGADSIWGGGGDDLITGGVGDDSLDGMTGADTIDGGDGSDVVHGGGGDDSLTGGGGADTLAGGGGDDILDGGAGADVMFGGAGDDTYIVDDAADVAGERPGQGFDVVESSVSYTLRANVEDLTLIGDAAVAGTGNALGNIIAADSGSFVANVLSGLGGADTLLGESGQDTLLGGAGNDVLYGSWDADSLVGGAGDDIFVYHSWAESNARHDAVDTIRGFDGAGAAGGDRIDLSLVYDGTLTFVHGAFTGAGQVHVTEAGGGDSMVEANLGEGRDFNLFILVQDGGVAASDYSALDFFL